MKNRLKSKSAEPADIDMKVFMNLMVVLIPMLVVAAEFATVAAVEVRLPQSCGCCLGGRYGYDYEPVKINLTAVVTGEAITIGGKGGYMPGIGYKEFHRYVTRDGSLDTLVEYTPGEMPLHPATGRELTIHERFDIHLYAVDGNRDIITVPYTRFGEMLTDENGYALRGVSAGDTVYAVTNPRRRIVVKDPADFDVRPLSVYDEFKNILMQVKERYSYADDAEDITLGMENGVLYDKIIQLMDAAHGADFPNISFAKLRG
ncbi:MAG: biopolymer transporter ExbD [Chitinispirillia bacterium]|nr:biopolymer transporter ExbD [Chitinispirillia bacterium]MCL2242599.1 biopolymer transporter ExbD [Chitinispirillia bacterium]